MPLNPDGTYTASMPSLTTLTGGVQAPVPPEVDALANATDLSGDDAETTSSPYGYAPPRGRGGRAGYRGATTAELLRNEKRDTEQKPEYQPIEDLANFKDYLDLQQKKNPALSLGSATDAQLLQHAQEYADTYFPGAYLAHHGKIDKNYLKTLSSNWVNKLSRDKNLDEIRDYYKQNGPSAPLPPAGLIHNADDLAEDVVGNLSKATGQTITGLANTFNKVPSLSGYLLNKFAPDFNPVQSVGNALQQGGDYLQSRLSPEYKQATSSEAPLSTLKGAAFVGNTLANVAPVLGASAVNPIFGLTAGAAQGGQALQDQAKEFIHSLPEEELAKSPQYQALLQDKVNPQVARETLAKQAGDTAFSNGLGLGGAFSVLGLALPFSKYGQNIVGKAVGNGLIKRVLGTTAAEAPVMGGFNVANQAALQSAENQASGQNTPLLNNAGQSFKEGLAQGAVLGPLAAYAHTPETQVQSKTRSVPPTTSETTPLSTSEVDNSPIGGDAVSTATRQAFSEVPIPSQEELKNPMAAQKSYNDWLTSAQADLEAAQGLSTDQVRSLEPQLKQTWLQTTQVDPALLGEVQTPIVQQDEIAPRPEGSQQQAVSPAMVREAQESEPSPDLNSIIAKELQSVTGREPSPEEVDRVIQQTTEQLSTQPGVNTLIPKTAREEAVRQLITKKKDLPTPEEINAVAKQLLKNDTKSNILGIKDIENLARIKEAQKISKKKSLSVMKS